MQLPPFNVQLIAHCCPPAELYNVLVRLSYLDPNRLGLPPHNIPETVIQKFARDMDPVVLDLIQRMPHIKGLLPIMIAPGTKTKNIAYDLAFAQNPLDLDDTEEEYIEKWSVCFTDGLDEGRSGWLVLNTRQNTITKAEWDVPYAKPQDTPSNSYNWQQAFPAEDFLRDWIRRFVELEWIPWSGLSASDGEILEADGPDQAQVPHYHELKALCRSHGWPDAFRKDEFTEARDAYFTKHKQVILDELRENARENAREL